MASPIVLFAKEFLKSLFVRKVAERAGLTKTNALRDSTILGAGTFAAGALVSDPSSYVNAILADSGVVLGPEYDLIIRVIVMLLGVYAIITEKKT